MTGYHPQLDSSDVFDADLGKGVKQQGWGGYRERPAVIFPRNITGNITVTVKGQ